MEIQGKVKMGDETFDATFVMDDLVAQIKELREAIINLNASKAQESKKIEQVSEVYEKQIVENHGKDKTWKQILEGEE